MVELSNMEKLAIAQAFQTQVGKMTKTGVDYNLRGEVDAEMREMYESTGSKTFDVKLLGRKVGTYYLTISKPTESKTERKLAISDGQALFEWAMRHDFIEIDMKKVERHFQETGELPDGCEAYELMTLGDMGGEITRTTLKVDGGKVISALGPQLEPIAYSILDGGIDE